jgi:hypothetical protein
MEPVEDAPSPLSFLTGFHSLLIMAGDCYRRAGKCQHFTIRWNLCEGEDWHH